MQAVPHQDTHLREPETLIMKYIHVKNLDKYHPGYKDRTLQWAKVYFKMAQGDPDVEMLCEVDWGRFVKLILLELQAQTPIPLNEAYLTKKGFDLKLRPMSLTIQMLHNFIEVVTDVSNLRHLDKEEDKEQEEEDAQLLDGESRVGKEEGKERKGECPADVLEFLSHFNLKTGKRLTMSHERRTLVAARLKTHTLDQLKTAVDNFAKDDWPDRQKYMDFVYCIGIRNKVDNLERWLNFKPKEAAWVKP